MRRNACSVRFVLILVLAVHAFSQGYGQLEGVARDPQGLLLPGATVTLSGEAVMGRRLTVTGVDGSYRFPGSLREAMSSSSGSRVSRPSTGRGS